MLGSLLGGLCKLFGSLVAHLGPKMAVQGDCSMCRASGCLCPMQHACMTSGEQGQLRAII